jgi:hypothetical protein
MLKEHEYVNDKKDCSTQLQEKVKQHSMKVFLPVMYQTNRFIVIHVILSDDEEEWTRIVY